MLASYIARMSTPPRVLAVCRGTVRDLESTEGPWRSAIHKEPATGSIRIGTRGVEGDCCADTRHHGSPDQAVLVYPSAHYEAWREALPGIDPMKFVPGGFGENLSVEHLDEESVRIGDRFTLGSVELEVTMPRVPCFKLNRKFGSDELLDRVRATGRTGFYARVLAEGTIETPAELQWSPRTDHDWTAARVHRAFHQGVDPGELESLSAIDALGEMLKSWIATRAV